MTKEMGMRLVKGAAAVLSGLLLFVAFPPRAQADSAWLVLVPLFQVAGLALSIGLGALVNATWLLVGLMRRGSYRPQPGWAVFALQVVAASALLAVFLMWAASSIAWIQMADGRRLWRIGLMALILRGSGVIYFTALWASGMKLRRLLRH